jgi:hypothetical protein
VPAALKVQLDGNAMLMTAYGLQTMPAMVCLNDKGKVQARQCIPNNALPAVLGPK